MNLNSPLKSKKNQIIKGLRECGSVLVAFSGGVDSAVLLALAIEALGADRVLAVTGVSPSLASGQSLIQNCISERFPSYPDWVAYWLQAAQRARTRPWV